MLLVKVFVLVVLLVVMLVLLVLGVGWLRRWYPNLRRYEGRRWDARRARHAGPGYRDVRGAALHLPELSARLDWRPAGTGSDLRQRPPDRIRRRLNRAFRPAEVALDRIPEPLGEIERL